MSQINQNALNAVVKNSTSLVKAVLLDMVGKEALPNRENFLSSISHLDSNEQVLNNLNILLTIISLKERDMYEPLRKACINPNKPDYETTSKRVLSAIRHLLFIADLAPYLGKEEQGELKVLDLVKVSMHRNLSLDEEKQLDAKRKIEAKKLEIEKAKKKEAKKDK